ncbi:unnamed protein product [Lepidochelys olivacea]
MEGLPEEQTGRRRNSSQQAAEKPRGERVPDPTSWSCLQKPRELLLCKAFDLLGMKNIITGLSIYSSVKPSKADSPIKIQFGSRHSISSPMKKFKCFWGPYSKEICSECVLIQQSGKERRRNL